MDEAMLPYVAAGVVVVLTLVLMVVTNRKPKAKPFLKDPSRPKMEVQLIERTPLSHDVVQLRFGLPSKNSNLGLPVGKCIKVFGPNKAGVKQGEWNGRPDSETGEDEIERKYTPTSSDSDLGYFDLVVKVYEPNVPPRFPDGGKISTHLGSLAVGDSLGINGPWGMIEYKGNGLFLNGKKELRKKHIGMMAGGSGITPMLQVVNAVLSNPNDQTTVSLLFANKTKDDILLLAELEMLAKQHADRFQLWFTLDDPPAGWKFSKGFITTDMIQERMPAPGPDTVILMCGPPPMVQYACKANLEKLGYEKADMLAF